MPPATFFVGPDGARCHAMGTGRNPHRRQLPPELLDAFFAERRAESEEASLRAGPGHSRGPGSAEDPEAEAALGAFLQRSGYYAVHDAGALRLALLLKRPAAAADGDADGAADAVPLSAAELWAQSTPRYPDELYLGALQRESA